MSFFAALLLGLAWWYYTLEVNPVIAIPAPVLPHPNAREYFVRAGDQVGDVQVTAGHQRYSYGIDELESCFAPDARSRSLARSLMPASQPAPTRAIAEAFVKAQAPALATLHRGFAFDYSDAQSPYLTYRQANQYPYTNFHTLARMLALTGRIEAQHGDWTAATDRYLDAIQLGEEIQHGGNIAAALVGTACQGIGRAGAWEAVPHLSGVRARAAARRMETTIARTPSFVTILRQEKDATLGWLNDCFHQPGWRARVFNLHPDHDSYWVTVYRYGSFSKSDIAKHVTGMMDHAIASVKQGSPPQSAALTSSGDL